MSTDTSSRCPIDCTGVVNAIASRHHFAQHYRGISHSGRALNLPEHITGSVPCQDGHHDAPLFDLLVFDFQSGASTTLWNLLELGRIRILHQVRVKVLYRLVVKKWFIWCDAIIARSSGNHSWRLLREKPALHFDRLHYG